ncbi:MAG: 2-C-methyl-D-erythritol 4-phosphate cytidylyltransferase [Parachlamydiales bacterium]|jgi:2-C-methyl-D-erythritol 4-phosphate cytidylyltransferase
MTQNASVAFILLAGGSATRMGGSIPKPFISLKGKPVINYSLDLFEQVPHLTEIVVVCAEAYHPYVQHDVTFALPGKRRQDSVLNGIKALKTKPQLIAVHDAARPLIDLPLLERIIAAATLSSAALAAVPVKSTIKFASTSGHVEQTPDRNLLWEAQTPQIFTLDLLLKAFHDPINTQFDASDDAALVERIGHRPTLVMGSYSNIKLTTPEDIPLAESFLI